MCPESLVDTSFVISETMVSLSLLTIAKPIFLDPLPKYPTSIMRGLSGDPQFYLSGLVVHAYIIS